MSSIHVPYEVFKALRDDCNSLKTRIIYLKTKGYQTKDIVKILKISTSQFYNTLAPRTSYQAKYYKEMMKKKPYYHLKEKVARFKKKNGRLPIIDFNCHDVIAKFGLSPICALSGRHIDYAQPDTYQLDHIISSSRGGSNELDNMQICCREANLAKHTGTKE